jgi:transcriptional regulator with XRE-family HTH domain
MSTGSRIRERRKHLGLSADQLAEKLGVSRSTVFRYENGDIEKVPLDYLGVLSSVLCTTPEYLMGWSDDPFVKDTTVYSKPDLDLTPFEREVITRLRRYSEEKQRAFLLILTGEDTPEP